MSKVSPSQDNESNKLSCTPGSASPDRRVKKVKGSQCKLVTRLLMYTVLHESFGIPRTYFRILDLICKINGATYDLTTLVYT